MATAAVETNISLSDDKIKDYTKHEHAEEAVTTVERLWYKEAVFYEVYVRAFCDLDGTGHGGITGITSRLDYLHYLGVDCIWLLPIYPSPLKDDGYDVADYCDIHPDYGTIENFRTLVKATHERNMKIIVDFIPNHCSEKHRWFQEARKSRDNPYRDYFVWTDDISKYKDARIIFVDVEKSNWTWDEVAGQYYWHRFFKEQPDLNFDNPKVQDEMLRTMGFWLDIGIDGFRVDAVPYLFERDGTSCENLPETHDFLKRMRIFIDTNYPGKIMLAEACQMPNEVRKYFGDTGDEFNLGFHFPVMPRIYMAIKRADGTCLKDIMDETPEIPPNCQWVTFLRNHDELTLEMVTPEERKWMWEQYAPNPRMKINMGIRRRLAPLMDGDQRRIELAYSLLFTLPGSPIIYYGDEIGMGDNIWLDDRNGVRTPMQWSSDHHGGFSPAQKIYAPVINDEEYGFHKVNVDAATRDPSSIYHVVRTMLQRRRKHIAYGHGTFQYVKTSTPAVFSFLRSYGIDRMLNVHNLSGIVQKAIVYLPETEHRATIKDLGEKNIGHSHTVSDVITEFQFTVLQNGTLEIELEPYQYLWLNLGEMAQSQATSHAQPPASQSGRRHSTTPQPTAQILNAAASASSSLGAISEE